MTYTDSSLAEYLALLRPDHKARREYEAMKDALKELIEAVCIGPLDMAAKYGPDVAHDDLIDRALSNAHDALSQETNNG